MAVFCRDHDSITRDQFTAFDRLCSEIAISDDDRRRVLLLSAEEWAAWRRVRDGGPVPANPDTAMMLLRLGRAWHRLSVAAERRR